MKYIVNENGHLVSRQCPQMPMQSIPANARPKLVDELREDNADRADKNMTAKEHYRDLVEAGTAIEWVEHEHPLACYDPALPDGALVELADVVYDIELEACHIARKKKYRKTGDVMDMLSKSINDSPATFSDELKNWAQECKGIKQEHPKPAKGSQV